MKAKNTILLCALLLSGVFSFVYLKFFSLDAKMMNVYAVQVGIYSKEENANEMIETLKNQSLNGYRYQKDDSFIVVSDVLLDKEEATELGNLISQKGITCLVKEYSIQERYKDSVSKKELESVLKEF